MSDILAPVKLPLGAEEIATMLPHRYPFLLLDRVTAFEQGKRVTALKNVTINEPFFQGHFPGHPVMPGVLIVEAMAQAAGVLIQLSRARDPSKSAVFYLVKVDNARFTRAIVPGRPTAPGGRNHSLGAQHEPVPRPRLRRRPDRHGSGRVVRRGGQLMIHATALVDPAAKIGVDVSIGAYSIIGADVEIGDRTWIGPHVVIEGTTRIGRDNRIFQFASLGAEPQDKKFHGERSELVIGDRNVIREFVTFNRGTSDGGGATRIGDDNWIMAYVHIAHDCQVGNHVVFANNATLAGHVEVGDFVILGGFTGIHQFCKIGAHAFTGMGSLVNADVPPFVIVAGPYAKPRGVNSEGLKRRGFDAARIGAIKRAYRALYVAGAPLAEARVKLSEQAQDSADVAALLDFIERSERALVR